MKDLLPVNRVTFRDISIHEGINAIRALDSRNSIIPTELNRKSLDEILNAVWIDNGVKADAQESLMGVLNSIENNLAKQTELHSRNLISTYNYNNGLRTTEILKTHHVPAKLFSVAQEAASTLNVKGQGFTWNLRSIDTSEEIVPSKFLERLTLLKHNGIVPDALFVAVPFAQRKLSLMTAVKNDMGKALYAIPNTFAGMAQLEDPLLICGFGKSPMFLVQIGKWI